MLYNQRQRSANDTTIFQCWANVVMLSGMGHTLATGTGQFPQAYCDKNPLSFGKYVITTRKCSVSRKGVIIIGKLRISLVFVISGTLFSRKYLQDCHPNL